METQGSIDMEKIKRVALGKVRDSMRHRVAFFVHRRTSQLNTTSIFCLTG